MMGTMKRTGKPTKRRATPEARLKQLELERKDVVRVLRDLCADFGDNDWPSNLHLGDALDKHLGDALYEEQKERVAESNRRLAEARNAESRAAKPLTAVDRAACLGLALQWATSGNQGCSVDPPRIVAAAQVFEGFLRGDQRKAG